MAKKPSAAVKNDEFDFNFGNQAKPDTSSNGSKDFFDFGLPTDRVAEQKVVEQPKNALDFFSDLDFGQSAA